MNVRGLITTLAATCALAPLTSFAKALEDGQIIGIVHSANHAEINSSEKIKGKSAKDGLNDFASKMISEHTDVDKKLDALSASANLPSAESSDSKKIDQKGDSAAKKLDGKDGKGLDKTYIKEQIAMHEDVLKMLKKKLIPEAKNAELKAMLEEIKTSVEGHLSMAKDLKKSL